MNELIEIYTKSKTFDNISEIMKEVNRIRTEMTDCTFEELARYVCDNQTERKILVELQVSTKWCRDNDIGDFIELVAYEFEGELPDYSADVELKTVEFNGNWKTAIEQMKKLALEVSNYEYKKCKPLIGKKMDIFDSMSDEEFYRYMKGDIDINIEI